MEGSIEPTVCSFQPKNSCCRRLRRCVPLGASGSLFFLRDLMTTKVTAEMEQAMNKAKIALMAKPDSVFFTTLCFSLRHEYSDRLPTAATNGKRVRYNPEFFMGLDVDERVFLMLHETSHVAYFHCDKVRVAGRDPRKWNIAADHVINLSLIERGFKMPQGGLADPQFKGMSTEEVYNLIKDEDCKSSWDDLDMEGEPGVTPEALQREIEDALIRAAMQSRMAGDKPGTIPGDIEIFLNKLLNPKLPWQRILQKWFQKFAKVDYSFARPNRRYFPRHLLPGLQGHALVDLAFTVDTSGSVSDEQFRYFVSECASLLRMMKPAKLTLIQFDHGIRAVDEIRNVQDLLRVKFTGRGGTNLTEVIEWTKKHKPQAMLVFTDGYFDMPALDTKTDIVWLIHDNTNFTAPKGKVIHYEIPT